MFRAGSRSLSRGRVSSFLGDLWSVSRQRKLRVEALEDRRLLSVVGGDLHLTIDAESVCESDGTGAATATVTRTTSTVGSMVLDLASSDPTEAVVPATVTIPDGSASATFSIDAVDDTVMDDIQTVTISAATQDRKFGGLDGVVTLPLTTSVAAPRAALAQQTDGKTIVAVPYNWDIEDDAWQIIRLNADGTTDATFGTGGIVRTPGHGNVSAILIQPDGRFLVGGSGFGRPALACYHPDGTLDTSFGSNGFAELPVDTGWVQEIALRSDGKIVLGIGLHIPANLRVAQLHADGTPDMAFGVGGVADIISVPATFRTMAIQEDGRILLICELSNQVVRLLPDGAMDASFGTGGIVTVDGIMDAQSFTDIAIDSAGRIVLAGQGVYHSDLMNETLCAARLNADGSLDSSFGGDGSVVTDLAGGVDAAESVLLQADGRVIIIAETTASPGKKDLAIVRYNVDGSLDSSLDGDGRYIHSVFSGMESVMGALLQDDGILQALVRGDYGVFRVARYGMDVPIGQASDTLVVTDDEGLILSETAGGTRVSETGTTDTFSVILGTAPTSNVVITVTSDDTGEVTADKASLTFTPADWNVAQTVTVTGVDDWVVDGDQETSIRLSIDDANSDDIFDPLSDQIVSVTTTDYEEFDFGDAPDIGAGTGVGNYNTLESDNGPSHLILQGLHMGVAIDGDDGMLQDAVANADDMDQLPDDEDGLIDPATDLALTLGTQPTVNMTVTNTTGTAATLSGWIDFNNDGVFDNATERAQAIVPDGMTGGTVTLAFAHLLTEYTGSTYARFRLGTDSAANEPTGRAWDGEVEDYAATISGVPGIDLQGMGFDATPDNLLESGGTATVAFLLRNFGDTASGAFDVQFYLSDDAIIDPASDILLSLDSSDPNYDSSEPEAFHMAGLASAGRHEGVVTLSVPQPDPFGTDNEYFLGMFVDADGDIAEANEANNHSSGHDLDYDDVKYTTGPLDHFEWDLVASPQSRGVPFSAQVRATDSYGWTITSYNDTVDLSGWAADGASSTIVITECNPDLLDYVEVQNVSGQAVDTTGWAVALNNAVGSDINAVHSVTWSLPGVMGADEIMYRTDSSSDNYWGSNIWWADKGWAMIVDDVGDVVDFVVWGYTSSQIASMSVVVNGHTVTIDSEWSGDGIALAGSSSLSLQRTSSTDNNGASDLSWMARSKGTQNVAITVPFASRVSIAPDSATFVAGVWSGEVTVLKVAADMHLRADDASGHVAITNTFDVIPGPGNFDFGDAPDPGYPTLLASEGARHHCSGPTLGSLRDGEDDGSPSTNADGDDDPVRSDDEDGVTFGSIRVGQTDAVVTVNVQNAPSGAKLDAWIDFNADGSWGGPGERIADAIAVVEGDNLIEFDVPNWAASGATYARFRLSTSGGLAPGGEASDGEVEDYVVNILPPVLASGIFGVQQVIATDADGVASVFSADLDGDGDLDMLSALSYSGEIVWYENTGGGVYGSQQVVTDAANAASSVFAADLDGDGDPDVLSASAFDDKIAWYENTGGGTFGGQQIITTDADYARSVFAGDLDGDGDLDVLSASAYDDKIAWYRNDGAGTFGSQQIITTDADYARSVLAVDLDGDGDLDAISASSWDNKIAWYRNSGDGVFGTERIITMDAAMVEGVYAADLDGDGDLDLLSASALDDKIAWYENSGVGAFGSQRIITTDAEEARSVFAADLDGDGDLDVVSASSGDGKIAWYENYGVGTFSAQQVITTDAGFAASVFAADLDGDGDLDAISASVGDDKIAWYRNAGFDFGDAPSPYPTRLADAGASHSPVGPTLGSARDDDQDGQPTDNADGDDTDGIDDEDGVAFGSIRVGQMDAVVSVNIQNAPTGAKLDAWIDFNADGSWGGPFEQIADGLAVVEGDNTVEFDVPVWAVSGEAYGRFRLSTSGDLAPGGAADDGEVEDYQVSILSPVPSSGRLGPQQIVASGSFLSLFAADLDGDGDLDVLSGGGDIHGDTIAWHENSGAGTFGTQRVITTDVKWPQSIFTADLDGDGDLDVLATSSWDDNVTWYENIGNGNFGPQRTITTDTDAAYGVYAADLDGDGDQDVLSASYYDDKIAWYENNGDGAFGTQRLIATDAENAQSVFAADLDGDGDVDVVSVSSAEQHPYQSKIAWYENGRAGAFGPGQVIATDVGRAHSVIAADLDGDGDLDVLSGSLGDFGGGWYENYGSGAFGPRQAITTGPYGPWSMFAADLDGDGDQDVLAAGADIVAYENNGDGTFGSQQLITTHGAQSVLAGDVDGDGDLDVLSACYNFNNCVAWYENLGFDFGDAATPYPTLAADDGARHVKTGPTLGPYRDEEADGQPTANADGDDTDGIDDEDGVTTPPLLTPGLTGTTLTVNASAPSFLNAWIDFDRDGVWESSEQVAVDVPMVAGSNTLSFDVSASAVPGQTYARLRLTSYDTGGTLAPTGPADDGEVEDYAWTIGENAHVNGSSNADDVITVRPGVVGVSQHQVSVNGTLTSYDPTVYNVLHIDGLGGNDTITIHGTNQNETVTLQPGSADVVGQTYLIRATNVEDITVNAGTGTDQVTMTGSADSNRLYSYTDYARLADSPRTFSYRVDGFEEVTVEAPGSGRDYAYLYDSPDNDVLDAGPDRVILERAVDTADATVTTATGFGRAYAYATNGGNDTATLTGAADARNRFYGYADYAILTESRRSFYFYARGFDGVTGESPGSGRSYAYLYDSSGTDALTASPTSATMDRASGWSDTTATGFKRVYGYSSRGGDDTARLTGSAAGGNHYRGYPSYSTLTDRARSFYHFARGFSSVTAIGSQTDPSGDRAYLYDSSGEDTLLGRGSSAILKDTAETTYQIEALYFDRVYARSSDRTVNDTVDVDDSLVYNLIRTGTW